MAVGPASAPHLRVTAASSLCCRACISGGPREPAPGLGGSSRPLSDPRPILLPGPCSAGLQTVTKVTACQRNQVRLTSDLCVRERRPSCFPLPNEAGVGSRASPRSTVPRPPTVRSWKDTGLRSSWGFYETEHFSKHVNHCGFNTRWVPRTPPQILAQDRSARERNRPARGPWGPLRAGRPAGWQRALSRRGGGSERPPVPLGG